MGMRATLGDREVKYSWPLSEAIATAIGDDRLKEMVDDYYLSLTKADVERLILAINDMFTNGITDRWSEPGVISSQFALKVGFLGITLNDLIYWHNDASESDTLDFG